MRLIRRVAVDEVDVVLLVEEGDVVGPRPHIHHHPRVVHLKTSRIERHIGLHQSACDKHGHEDEQTTRHPCGVRPK